MKSNKKILTSIDLSRNDVYNVSQIVGSEYSTSPMGQDLIVQALGNGNITINSTTGKVQLLSGSTSWSNGTVTDNVTKRNNLSSGVEVTGTGVTIANGSTSGSIIADAPDVALRECSPTDAEKTSIKLSSTNDSVAVKGAVISEIATTSETVDAPTMKIGSTNTTNLNITSSTSLGLDVIAKADTTYVNANGTTRTCNSLLKANNANVTVLDATTVDIAGNLSVAHGTSFDTDALFKNNNFKLESNQIDVDRHADTTADHKFKMYAGTTTANNYQYNNKNSKAAKNSQGYIIVDDITSNVELDAQVVDIHDNFDINVSTSKHATIKAPEVNTVAGTLNLQAGGTYTFSENHGSTIANPTLTVQASTSGSSISVSEFTTSKATVNGSTHITEADPALKVDGAATITRDVFLNGNLSFDSTTGKILNTNASKVVEIETDNIKLTGANTTVHGSTLVDINSPVNIDIRSIGATASLGIKVGTTSSSISFEVAASTTTSSINVENANIKNISATRGGTFDFSGSSFSTSATGVSSIYSTTLNVTGVNSLKISSSANNLDIDAGSSTASQSKIKATNIEAVSNITAASSTVTGDASFGGNITVAGDVQLSGNGLIKSTSSVKNIQIQGEHLVDIRTAGAGSTATSIIYADTSTTYINGSNIKASNSLTVDNIATVDTTHAAFQVPTEVTRKLTVSYSGNDALEVLGNVSMNNGTINSTTINGSTVSIQPVNTVIGSSTKDVAIAGKNNLTIMSNQSTSASYIRATNMRADNSLQVNNFSIYYDTTTSSLVFAQGV